ncbi:MAG: hypothetical protein KKD38_08530 [Candidatus Delongbacteria bacterium]|nr:hypothetical protein [Candidatus Delongbacteria bacterium]MCG2760945.1 hypothetical protein [Candidatus Delongbacteria bacterium]
MKTISKILTSTEANRIIEIYSKFNLEHLSKLISHNISEDGKIELEFEWVEGSVISEEKMGEAFYELGRFHLLNRVADREVGFTTVCHGDFHRNNIVVSDSGIRFVDVTFIKEEWNYSDLDYVDFFEIYDKSKYPWMIGAGNCLEAYHEGAGIRVSKKENEKVKTIIAESSLARNIENGRKNKLNTSFEEQILEILKHEKF